MTTILADFVPAYFEPILLGYALPVPLPDALKSKSPETSCIGTPAGKDGDSLLIRNVSAVGALYTKKLGLNPRDAQWIKLALETCSQNGFSIASDLRVSPFNLAAGHDFLSPSRKVVPADLVVLCAVHNPSLEDWLWRDDPHASHEVSAFHYRENSWPDAAQRDGAKALVTFCQEEYSMLQTSAALLNHNYPELRSDKIHVAFTFPGDTAVVEDRLNRELVIRSDLAGVRARPATVGSKP